MSHITIIDNTPNQRKSLQKYSYDCENLRKIANKTLGDLQSESGILIFPPKIEDTDDQIKDSVIFTLKENENSFSLGTGNLMGFIGRNALLIKLMKKYQKRMISSFIICWKKFVI